MTTLDVPSDPLNTTHISEKPFENNIRNPLDDSVAQEVSDAPATDEPTASKTTVTPPIIALIDYFYFQGFYHHILDIRQHASSMLPTFHYPAIEKQILFLQLITKATLHIDINDTIREVEQRYLNDPDYVLAACSLLLSVTKTFAHTDAAQQAQLKTILKSQTKTDNLSNLLNASRFFLYHTRLKQGKQCIEKLLSRERHHWQGLVLYGWFTVLSSTSNSDSSGGLKKAHEVFSTVLKHTSPEADVGATLGRIRTSMMLADYARATEDCNSFIVRFESISVGLVEKAKVQLLFGNNGWDDVISTLQRAQRKYSDDLQATLLLLLYNVTNDSGNVVANDTSHAPLLQTVKDAVAEVERVEPKNTALLFTVGQLLSRAAYNHDSCLRFAISLFEKLISIGGGRNTSQYLYEKANAHLLLQEYNEALKYFQACQAQISGNSADNVQNDDHVNAATTNLNALMGTIRVKVATKRLDEAQDLLDDVVAITGGVGGDDDARHAAGENENAGDPKPSELMYLQALVALRISADSDSATAQSPVAFALLQSAVCSHARSVNSIQNSVHGTFLSYVIALNGRFICECLELWSNVCPFNRFSEQLESDISTKSSKLSSTAIGTTSTLTSTLTLRYAPVAISAFLSSTLRLLQQMLSVWSRDTRLAVVAARVLYCHERYNESEGVITKYLQRVSAIASPMQQASASVNGYLASLYLLFAQLHVAQYSNYKAASQCMEQARLVDLQSRSTVVYHTLKAKLLVAGGQLDDAIKVLNAALDLQGVKRRQQPQAVSLSDRQELYLQLVRLSMHAQQTQNAGTLLSEAKSIFGASPRTQQSQKDSSKHILLPFFLLELDLATKNHDVDSAQVLIRQLNTMFNTANISIPKSGSASIDTEIKIFLGIQIAKGRVYEKLIKDKKQFITCYNDIVKVFEMQLDWAQQQDDLNKEAAANNLLYGLSLLANAYIHTTDYDAAIAVYEKALQHSPQNAALSSAIGRLLVAIHDYGKAVNYYESSIAQRSDALGKGNFGLYHELARLYLHLKHYDEAVQTLQQVLQMISAEQHQQQTTTTFANVELQQTLVNTYLLLADVYMACHEYEAMYQQLCSALEQQKTVVREYNRSASQSEEQELAAQQFTAATLCYRIACYYQQYAEYSNPTNGASPEIISSDNNTPTTVNATDTQIIYYCETCIHYCPTFERAYVLLARTLLLNNQYDRCQQWCHALLEQQTDHRNTTSPEQHSQHSSARDEIHTILADIFVKQDQADVAIQQYMQMINDYQVTEVINAANSSDTKRTAADTQHLIQSLSALTNLLRRAGRLQEVPAYIELVQKKLSGGKIGNTAMVNNSNVSVTASTSPSIHIALSFIKGCYELYIQRSNTALELLNLARLKNGSVEVRRSAMILMIQIYLNLLHYNWHRVLQDVISGENQAHGESPIKQYNERLSSASKLLNELHINMATSTGSDRHVLQVLELYVMAYQIKLQQGIGKVNYDQLLEKVVALCSEAPRDYIPALLLLVYVYFLKNDSAKAKAQLKRIVKLKINMSYLPELEHSWLLLAEIYSDTNNSAKLENAHELCKRCIAYNKSNIAAYELLGSVYEKQSAWSSAVDCYELVWHQVKNTTHNTHVGYKLAWNYVREKQWLQAVQITQAILQQHPNDVQLHNKMKKDVLIKARENLRA